MPLTILLLLHPTISLFVSLSIMALHLLRLSYFLFFLSTTIFFTLLHLLRSPGSIVVVLAGILILFRLVHPAKALPFIVVTFSGIIILVRAEQS